MQGGNNERVWGTFFCGSTSLLDLFCSQKLDIFDNRIQKDKIELYMDITTVSRKLNISVSEIKKKSLKDFLERNLLETKSEIFALASKYGAKGLKEFDKMIKKGKIHEDSESREDFFKLDRLESKREIVEKLLGSL